MVLNIADRIKYLRERYSMTQTDLANATGIPQQQISKYIRGYRVPTFYNLDKIARALDCTIDELRYV